MTPQVGAISFDPFGERLAVEGFALPDPRGEEPAVACEELFVNIAFARLFRARLGLEEIGLVGLRVSARAREAMSSALSARNHPSPDGRACDRDASRLGRRKFLPVA